MPSRILSVLIALSLFALPAFAQFDEASFRQALKVKKGVYLKEGSFSGGDRLSSNATITNVRVAANPEGYDRIVVDFSKLERPPFFLVQNDPHAHRVVTTLYGKVKAEFSTQSAIQAAKKTKSIKKIEFLPVVETDRMVFSVEVQGSVKTEVFELTGPARIIIDLKP